MENVPGASVQVDFTLAVGSGRLEASAVVPAGEITLTQLLPVLQNLTSDVIGSVAEIVQTEGYSISCRAGCAACCRQFVTLNLFEAEFLADWIRSLPEDRQTALAARFDAALIGLRNSGILARLDPSVWVPNDEFAKALAADYFKARVPCPFLENESCSIHPIRPLVCREFLVTSPAEYCYDPWQNPVSRVPMPLQLSEVLFRIGSHLDADHRGWIPLVFLFAWMKSGSKPGAAVCGPGPELLYEVVKRLSASTGKSTGGATAG